MKFGRLDNWQQVLSDLSAWHDSRDRPAANRALTHIESWLRARIPPIVRRRWSSDEIDDALQGFLERLLNKPLPSDLRKPGAYLNTAFRRWCIDSLSVRFLRIGVHLCRLETRSLGCQCVRGVVLNLCDTGTIL